MTIRYMTGETVFWDGALTRLVEISGASSVPRVGEFVALANNKLMSVADVVWVHWEESSARHDREIAIVTLISTRSTDWSGVCAVIGMPTDAEVAAARANAKLSAKAKDLEHTR